MTPFEKLGYKVGDKFEVVVDYLTPGYAKLGDIATFYKDDDTHCPYFKLENGGIVCFHIGQIIPLKTEAEKRGAKIGEVITFKPTGAKGVFWKTWKDDGEERWSVLMEDEIIIQAQPSQVRLDHEPGYREIPFSEATHEQRMVKGCVNWLGHVVDEIVRFKNGTYAWSFSGNPSVMVQTEYLTVFIPA